METEMSPKLGMGRPHAFSVLSGMICSMCNAVFSTTHSLPNLRFTSFFGERRVKNLVHFHFQIWVSTLVGGGIEGLRFSPVCRSQLAVEVAKAGWYFQVHIHIHSSWRIELHYSGLLCCVACHATWRGVRSIVQLCVGEKETSIDEEQEEAQRCRLPPPPAPRSQLPVVLFYRYVK